MITHIKTKGFKGQDINEDIHPKTLFYGPNTSGKSTRAAAISLTILGFVPFAAKTNKKPVDILNDFGVGDALTVAVVCGGVEFERHFYRTENGGVSQRLRVDKKKHNAAEFAVELAKAGDPRIIDVNDFVGLSDQKKMDMLFNLFPSKVNMKDLDSRLDKAKKAVTDLQNKDRSATAVIQRLTASKKDLQLPSGSFAELKAEIRKTADKIHELEAEIKEAEIAEAAAKAREAAERESTAKQADGLPSADVEKQEEPAAEISPGNQRVLDFVQGKPGEGEEKYPHFMKIYDEGNDPAISIQRIIDTLNDSGCEICAAAIVARQELKKFQKGVAA